MIDNTFTNVDLDFIAAVWSHNNQANATATFDNICISTTPANCTTTTTWDGVTWDSGVPNTTTAAIINGNYNTSTNNDIVACSLIINNGFTLTIDNNGFVEIETDLTVNGTLNVTNSSYIQIQDDVVNNNNITVQTQGNFIQVDDASSFTDNGISIVNKLAPPKPEWFFYTYWSSPVSGLNIETTFSFTPADRRFGFDAVNYLDLDFDGVPSVGGFVPAVTGTIIPGIGYAMTENPVGVFPFQRSLDFQGEFNNGEIMIPIEFNAANISGIMGAHFNFIGNPYPSALDFDAFQAANSTLIDGIAYFWSQASPPDAANNGGSPINFSQNDYAVYTVGSGGTAGTGTPNPNAPGSTQIPTRFVPSGQGFFVISTAAGTATFNNSMRTDAATDNTSNSNFFGIEKKDITFSTSNSSTIEEEENRLWINLTSNNGIFNQILVAYVNGASNSYDGVSYDAPRIVPAGTTAILYTSIDEADNDSKYVIQGKAVNGIDENEIIPLGFQTNIDVDIATTYTLSVDSFKGTFIENNTVYLRDELLDITHDLSNSDYNFTSETGTFEDRFIIQFVPSSTLSSDDVELAENTLAIIELENGDVQFRVSNSLEMETIRIIDLTGRELYNFATQGNDNTYNLSNLNQSIYIAQVTLSNGAIISKKAIKNN